MGGGGGRKEGVGEVVVLRKIPSRNLIGYITCHSVVYISLINSTIPRSIKTH